MEIKSSGVLFKWPKKLEGNKAPSHVNFFPKTPNQNFEMAILFSIVEKFINYVLEDDVIPRFPREELQVVNFAHCFK